MCKGHIKQQVRLVTQALVQTYQRLMHLRLIRQEDDQEPEEDSLIMFESDEFELLSEEENDGGDTTNH